MGLEIVILYSIYAIVGGIAGVTVINVAENITITSMKANAKKYVACAENEKNTAQDCKGLE